MRIRQIPVDIIKPDPNQPRQFIDKDRVREMAKSILTEGIINPIEVDEKNIIVTGEIRWRATKKAGLKTIPAKLVNFKGRKRFRRQVIENIHHNTMTAWDTAVALNQLLTPLTVKQGVDAGIRSLGRELGKSYNFVRDHVSLLKEEKMVKDWLKQKESKPSLIRETNTFVPEKFKQTVKDKIVKNKITGGDNIRELGKALRREPAKAKQLFDVDYQQPMSQVISAIHRISLPPIRISERVKQGVSIVDLMTQLIEKVKETDFEELAPVDQNAIIKLAQTLAVALRKFIIQKKAFIEGELIENE